MIETSSFCKSSKNPSLDILKKKPNTTPAPKKLVSVKAVLTSLGLTDIDGAALMEAVPAVKEYKDMIAAFLKFLVKNQLRWQYKQKVLPRAFHFSCKELIATSKRRDYDHLFV